MLPAMIFLMAAASSCNDKKEQTEEIAVTVSTVAIKSFNLKADSKVLSNLDSVFFSIDLANGVIFNADSLPKGTKITKLIPVITFMTSVSKAELKYTDTEGKEQTVNYLETTTDSINFTSPVTLNVTAYDEKTEYTYRLKVNVHEQLPDSLMWSELAVGKLPSRLDAPVAQKSVEFGDKALSVVCESDGTFTLAISPQLYSGEWEKSSLSLPFNPDLSSLTASGDQLFMLDTDGNLYSSPDAMSWSATGEKWVTIVGPYLGSVLGIRSDASGLRHCHYPASALIADTDVDATFPLTGRSALVSVYSKWVDQPTAFFVGGRCADGSVSGATWAFDGSRWATLNNSPVPALESPAIVKYYTYRNTSDIFNPREADSWIIIGGRRENGTFNKTLFYTHDNGVTWKEGSSLMQLPAYVPALMGSDVIVMDASHTVSLTDYWKSTPSRETGMWLKPAYVVDGYDITWECPYIYLIGGYDGSGRLSDEIYKGVLARLRFTPLI